MPASEPEMCLAVLASEVAARTVVPTKGAKGFSKPEAELVEVVDTFQRAISIIEKEMTEHLAFLQKRIDTRNMSNVVAALTAVIEAAVLSHVDKLKLVSLVQI